MRTGVMCPKGIICQYVNRNRNVRHFELEGFTALSLLSVILCNENIDIFSMCECMSFPQRSNKLLLTYLLSYLLAYLLTYSLTYLYPLLARSQRQVLKVSFNMPSYVIYLT